MSSINQLIGRLFKENTCYILAYMDFNKEFTSEFILEITTHLITNNLVFKNNIENEENGVLDIERHMSIKYVDKDRFNEYISIINDKDISNIFYLVCCIDDNHKASRIYIRVNHAYADGYKLLNMAAISIFKTDYVIPKFKRSTPNILSTLYNYTIGTIILAIIYIQISITLLWNISTYFNEKQVQGLTDYIICKPFKLDKIKKFASDNNITVNDFLYSVMIKTDQLYNKTNRNINTFIPFNVSNIEYTNNILPVLIPISNSLDNKKLLHYLHNIFDYFKYSLFIPILKVCTYTTNYMPINFMSFFYNLAGSQQDYMYTNMISPSFASLKDDLQITNVNFLISSNYNTIIFNSISVENNVNLICSFKNGIIPNKKKFKKCVYKAYKKLLKTV